MQILTEHAPVVNDLIRLRYIPSVILNYERGLVTEYITADIPGIYPKKYTDMYVKLIGMVDRCEFKVELPIECIGIVPQIIMVQYVV
jgi:hypothetical protein